MEELVLEFQGYRLWPQRRILEHGGSAVHLGDREFDLLVTLAERQGSVVSANEILRLVWPREHVDEAIVRVRVAQLRKSLSRHVDPRKLIGTVVGSGYVFLAGLTRRRASRGTGQPEAAVPSLTTRVIGRELEIDDAYRQLRSGRLLVITGPGGIGKTTVAVEVAHRLRDYFEDGSFFVDLAPVKDGALVSTQIALSLGIGLHPADPIIGLVAYLRYRRAFLFLDTCEHVASNVRRVVQRILEEAHDVTIVCTSRQTIGAHGESELRLAPLDLPTEDDAPAIELRRFSSVELFIERATASSPGFTIDEVSASMISRICRTLDGLPLAIEFAASRVGEFGVTGVWQRVSQPLIDLSSDRRTITPRHRTLRDTLEWSYESLDPLEKKGLRTLSCFAGNFSLQSAELVMGGGVLDQGNLQSLVAKSLVSSNLVSGQTVYRLLDMTRDFGREFLQRAGEVDAVARRHALDVLRLLEEAEGRFGDGITADWSATYGHRLGDLRAALRWAFDAQNDRIMAIQIAAAASIIFIPLGLLEEYLVWVERGLEENACLDDRDRTADVKLYTALGTVLHHARPLHEDNGAKQAFINAADAARDVGNPDGELRAWSALSAVYLVAGDYAAAMDIAKEFAHVPKGTGSLVEHRTLAHSTHFAGRLAESRMHIDHVLSSPSVSASMRNRGSQYDQKQVTLRSTHAQNLWLRGFPEKALAVVEECLDDALQGKHMVSLCQMLSTAGVPISMFVGGSSRCRVFLDRLIEASSNHSILLWQGWAAAYEAVIYAGQPTSFQFAGQPPVYSRNGLLAEYLSTLGSNLAPVWAVTHASKGDAGWSRAEVMRVRTERSLAVSGNRKRGREGFRSAFDEASKLDTLVWLPRIATSLAQLEIEDDCRAAAKTVLDRALEHFTEGLDVPDLKTARTLYASM